MWPICKQYVLKKKRNATKKVVFRFFFGGGVKLLSFLKQKILHI